MYNYKNDCICLECKHNKPNKICHIFKCGISNLNDFIVICAYKEGGKKGE